VGRCQAYLPSGDAEHQGPSYDSACVTAVSGCQPGAPPRRTCHVAPGRHADAVPRAQRDVLPAAQQHTRHWWITLMSFAHGGDSMSRPAANQSLDRLFRCTEGGAASGGALDAQCSAAPWTTVVGTW